MHALLRTIQEWSDASAATEKQPIRGSNPLRNRVRVNVLPTAVETVSTQCWHCVVTGSHWVALAWARADTVLAPGADTSLASLARGADPGE
jgi:hypothetical protein